MGDQGNVGENPAGGAELSAAIMQPGRAGPAGAGARAPGAPGSAPGTIGRFRILERLGVGGMGVVYKAQQERPHRVVALKVIRAGLLDARAVRRFELEAEILARLQHPGIAQIYETGTFDSGEGVQPYFAMELVEGRPLTRFAREHRLDLRERLVLMSRICDAVQHAHQRGVVHRDLKPANIMVVEAGAAAAVLPKILDFGVARATDADLSVTLSGGDLEYAAGTLPYMSPEQLAGGGGEGGGSAGVDLRSDVYSLGVVCYELLTDRLPYTLASNSIFEAARVIREQDPPSAGSVNRVLRGDIETILRTALEKEPSRRYQSAAELAGDIERFLNDEPIRARPPSALYRLRKFARRNRAIVTGLAVAFAVLLLGITATTWQAVRATRSEARTAERVNDLRAFARTVINDLDAAIRDLPDSAPARRILVQSALEYLDRLREDAGNDEGLLAELALGYESLAEIQDVPGSRNLGDVDGALESCQQAIELREILLRISPDDAERQRSLAKLHWLRGSILSWNARFDEATSELSLARETYRVIWQKNPDDSSARNSFVTASSRLADNYLRRRGDDRADVVALVYDTVTAIGALPEPAFASPDHDAHPALAHLLLCRLYQLIDQWSDAEGQLVIAQLLLEPAIAMYPSDYDFVLTLGDVHHHRANVLRSAGDAPAAVEEFVKALSVYQQVADANPTLNKVRLPLGYARTGLAGALADAGRCEEAIESAQSVVDAMEAEVAIEPNSATHRNSRLVAYDALGEVVERLAGDPNRPLARRLEWMRRARNEYQKCLDRAAEDKQLGLLIGLSERDLIDVRQSIGRCEAGIASLEAALHQDGTSKIGSAP